MKRVAKKKVPKSDNPEVVEEDQTPAVKDDSAPPKKALPLINRLLPEMVSKDETTVPLSQALT